LVFENEDKKDLRTEEHYVQGQEEISEKKFERKPGGKENRKGTLVQREESTSGGLLIFWQGTQTSAIVRPGSLGKSRIS